MLEIRIGPCDPVCERCLLAAWLTTIAFLGTGLMGTGFIRRARANGLTVRAWNRSAAKAQALAANDAAGVTACAIAAEAVRGAERIHLSLADDASVDAVFEPLAGALPAGAWVVDHTTTAVRPTAERVARWDSERRGACMRRR